VIGLTGSDDQRWPDEPDDPNTAEPDEADLTDIGPTVPEVEVPQPPDPAEADVPDGLARQFWKLVAVFNVALFALALGPMLIVFRGEWQNGSAVFAVGVAAFGYGYLRYRRVTGDDHNG
jgi:hypothetical protein